MYCVCVCVCTVLLPPGGYSIEVNKYISYHHNGYKCPAPGSLRLHSFREPVLMYLYMFSKLHPLPYMKSATVCDVMPCSLVSHHVTEEGNKVSACTHSFHFPWQCRNLPEVRSWVQVPYLTVHSEVNTFRLTEVSFWIPEIYKNHVITHALFYFMMMLLPDLSVPSRCSHNTPSEHLPSWIFNKYASFDLRTWT